MTFMDELERELENDDNVSITENGAVGYKTTNHYLLDMNFKVSSYRNKDDREIIEDFDNAYVEDPVHAIKWLFYARDVRGGLGERRLFRVIFKHISETNIDLAKALIGFISEYGRYDDLVELVKVREVEDDVIALLKHTLVDDLQKVARNEPISLLAKWMPSINTSSKETVRLARHIVKKFGWGESSYRKSLSILRSKLDIVEKKMSSNNWGNINYESVPSKANLLYKDAFMNHDEDRRKEYLDSVEKGIAKINSSVAFPHEIVHKYNLPYGAERSDKALEEMWKALPNFSVENTICVADGSGSMETRVDPHSNVTALEVANALAIYTAERCKGEFKDKYITFSDTPQLVNLGSGTLYSKIKRALAHSECANTNIEAVFDLILKTAIDANMAQEDLPKNILVISDMEFDSCANCNSTERRYGWDVYKKISPKTFDIIKRRYKEAGYSLPRLIFWNVCSRTCTIPVKENDMGVALVSGFSVNILKMVMSNELDPYKLLIDTLDVERYAPIEKSVHNVLGQYPLPF